MPTAVEVTERLYQRWNDDGVAALEDTVDPAIELIPDPLQRDTPPLRGIEGWQHWVERWNSYTAMRITVDALVGLDFEHVLALVSIRATPRGATDSLSWAAAHVWTVREGRIVGWQSHLDLALARETLDA